MDLSIVICTHNRADLLKKTLNSFSQAKVPPETDIELVVMANACSDDTTTEVARLSETGHLGPIKLRCIEEPKPGKSYALNRALLETHADTLCFVDDDQTVDREFLTSLITAIKAYPEYDIVCGKLAPAWDGSEPSWVHEKGEFKIRIRPFPEYDLGDSSKEITAKDKLPSGGNLTVRRGAFEKIGNFSEQIGPQGHNLMGGEDIDFVRRCLSAGSRIIYEPKIRQEHMILHDRLKISYMMRKSYNRTLSSMRANRTAHTGIKGYMIKKLLLFSLKSCFSGSANKRFYYAMRTASTLGEIRAATERRT